MIKGPDVPTGRPESRRDLKPRQGKAMGNDVLSDVLRTVRLSGAIFYEVRAGARWVTESPSGAWLASRMLPHAQHMIAYHVVTSGSCWVALAEDGARQVRLESGSIALFAHGDPHVMTTERGARAQPVLEQYRLPRDDERLPFYVDARDGRPEAVRILCGFLGCDVQPFNPLVQALPRLVHVNTAGAPGNGTLSALITATVAESSATRIGSTSMLSRLSELLFIEALRSYVETLPSGHPGWLGALADPCVGRVLRLLHGDPARAWTLKALGREAGFSRTVLVERFRHALGVAPMTYLLKWRMQIAASLLIDGAEGVARISSAVGYGSEEAFCRAFKRCMGQTPAEWRRRADRTELPAAPEGLAGPQ